MGRLRHRVLWKLEAIAKEKQGSLGNLRAVALLNATHQRRHGSPLREGSCLTTSPHGAANAAEQNGVGAD
jgi:hypothetical protein